MFDKPTEFFAAVINEHKYGSKKQTSKSAIINFAPVAYVALGGLGPKN